MPQPDPAFFGVSIPAIDMGDGNVRAIVHTPGNPPQEQRFCLPLPERDIHGANLWDFLGIKASEPQVVLAAEALPSSWDGLFADKEPPRVNRFFFDEAPAGMFLLRLQAIRDRKKILAADSLGACVAGVLARPGIRERSFRQGVTVLRVDASRVSGALIFQDRCFGVFWRPLSVGGRSCIPALLEDLAAFRLGWLPDEKLRAEGGAARFAGRLPEEAEGFAPLYLAGESAHLLAGHGKMALPDEDTAYVGCLGLLHAWRERHEPGFDSL